MTQPAPGFLAVAARPDVLWRSVRVALVVGTVLAVVNHGGTLLAGDLGAAELAKIGVSYLVPFCVATWSAVAQARSAPRQRP